MNYTNKKKLILILFLSIITKLIVVIFFHENHLQDEWKTLFDNYQNLKIYSFYNLEGFHVPSSYMPPLYFIFLIICNFLSFDKINFLYLVYFFQIIISTLSVMLFFNFCKKFASYKFSLIGTIVFAFFPMINYATALISSATLQIFLYLCFFNLILNFIEKKQINILKISILSSLCLLLRGEFLIIFSFSLLFISILDKKNIYRMFLVAVTTFFIISPYIIRNYLNTDSFHIVNVKGFALWKGNNQFSNVEGYKKNALHPNERITWPNQKEFYKLYEELDKIPKNSKYEVTRDKIFLNEAINNLLTDKIKYFNLYLKKVFSLYFIDFNSSYKQYYNTINILPILVVSLFSILGILKSVNKKKDEMLKKHFYIIFMLIVITTFVSLFFILPRYKISILNFQILYSIIFLEQIMKKKSC